MRTIVDLPEQHRKSLDELSARLGISRAEAVRRAITAYLQAHKAGSDAEVFGLWRQSGEDSLAYEDRVRQEWDRQ